MTRKRWTLLALSLLGLALALIIGTVALVDPFEVYHRATAFIPPITNGTQSYSNAGIAKTYDYDSVVIGSSMTENFRPSQLDALLGGSFVKLSINGGSPFNHKQMLDMAFATHDVRRVLYGLDIEAYTYFYITPKTEMPDYLYDDSLLNDVRYWFNKSVLTRYIPECLSTLGQSDPDQRDTMYMWGDLYAYGKDAALAGISFACGIVEQEPPSRTPAFSQQTMLNVEHNVLPYLTEHPDTEFVFFFPPYSLARWFQFYADGVLGYHLTQKEALVQTLLPYDNVRIYDFQAELSWIADLDHYIDAGHYGPWINDAMAEAISEDRYRVRSLSDVQENDAVLRRCADALAQAGEWVDFGAQSLH